MASKSVANVLLLLNLVLYIIITSIAASAVNHSIDKSHEAASYLVTPAQIFPIYFPTGNMATGFFVIFSLIAGVVGITTSVAGMGNYLKGSFADKLDAAYSSSITWLLTLLAMGLACKEINKGWTNSSLRTLEVLTIIVSGTQMVCVAALSMVHRLAPK